MVTQTVLYVLLL